MRRKILLLSFLFSNASFAEDSRWQFSLEGGAAFQTVNDVEIPPGTGTRFSLVDAIGKGPLPYVRFESKYTINDKHRLRLLIAPLSIEKEGQLSKEVFYKDKLFSANTETTYRYKFNSYRLSYAYRFFENPAWEWDVGFTAKIRDAEIKLSQGNTTSSYPNTGFVPLLHLNAARRINPSWQLLMDLDATGSPYGRAIDFGIFAQYELDKRWQIGAGYRTIEGGADVEKVYNFAWLHYFGLRLQINI